MKQTCRLRQVPAHNRRGSTRSGMLGRITSGEEACYALSTLRIRDDQGAAQADLSGLSDLSVRGLWATLQRAEWHALQRLMRAHGHRLPGGALAATLSAEPASSGGDVSGAWIRLQP